jgi:hypothetical protein
VNDVIESQIDYKVEKPEKAPQMTASEQTAIRKEGKQKEIRNRRLSQLRAIDNPKTRAQAFGLIEGAAVKDIIPGYDGYRVTGLIEKNGKRYWEIGKPLTEEDGRLKKDKKGQVVMERVNIDAGKGEDFYNIANRFANQKSGLDVSYLDFTPVDYNQTSTVGEFN